MASDEEDVDRDALAAIQNGSSVDATVFQKLLERNLVIGDKTSARLSHEGTLAIGGGSFGSQTSEADQTQ